MKEALKPYIEKLPEYLAKFDCNAIVGVNTKCPMKNHKSAHPFLIAMNRATGDYVWNCFACGEGGTIFELAASMHGYPRSNEAGFLDVTVRHLSDVLSIPFPEIDNSKVSPEEQFKRDLWGATREVSNHLSPAVVKEYATSRGWSQQLLEKFNIGGIANYNNVLSELRNRYSDKVLKTINFISRHSSVPSMFNDNRIIFTIHDSKGRPIGFTARALNHQSGAPRKYINSSGSPIFKKSNVLYNAHRALNYKRKNDTKVLYMVEGQADVVSLHNAGLESVVGISGTAFTDQHLEYIKKFDVVIACLDSDDGGEKATRKVYSKYKESTGKDIGLIKLPDGTDPDDFIKSNSLDAFLSLPTMLPEEWEIENESVMHGAILADYWIPRIVSMNSLYHSRMISTLSRKSGIDLYDLRKRLNLILLDEVSRTIADISLSGKVLIKIEKE